MLGFHDEEAEVQPAFRLPATGLILMPGHEWLAICAMRNKGPGCRFKRSEYVK